jgi:hypothetical protein
MYGSPCTTTAPLVAGGGTVVRRKGLVAGCEERQPIINSPDRISAESHFIGRLLSPDNACRRGAALYLATSKARPTAGSNDTECERMGRDHRAHASTRRGRQNSDFAKAVQTDLAATGRGGALDPA